MPGEMGLNADPGERTYSSRRTVLSRQRLTQPFQQTQKDVFNLPKAQLQHISSNTTSKLGPGPLHNVILILRAHQRKHVVHSAPRPL